MLLWIFILGLLAGFIAGVVLVYRKIASPLKKERIEDRKRSLSSLYGKITEQFAPFMERYPHNPKNFRFIGSPIDGIQFEDDKIIFVEFKSSNSKLTEGQKKMKEIVENKKVEWFEFDVKWE